MSEPTPEQVATAHKLVLEGRNGVGLRLPEPWLFDGTRQLYDMREPAGWTARAVNMTGPINDMVDVVTGEGVSPLDAAVDLVMKLGVQK